MAASIDMNEIAKEFRLVHWVEIVREREASGVSIREFCENEGIHENKYYYWQRKLREEACKELAKAQCKPTSMAPAVFAEVRVPERATLPSSGTDSLHTVCVETIGVRITAGSEYPIDKLAELFRAVSSPCC